MNKNTYNYIAEIPPLVFVGVFLVGLTYYLENKVIWIALTLIFLTIWYKYWKYKGDNHGA